MVGGQPPEGRKQITNLFATDDWACVEYDVVATADGPIELEGITLIPAGERRALELRVCVIVNITDGKMAVAREYWDSASMARQLGVGDAQLSAMYASLGSES